MVILRCKQRYSSPKCFTSKVQYMYHFVNPLHFQGLKGKYLKQCI